MMDIDRPESEQRRKLLRNTIAAAGAGVMAGAATSAAAAAAPVPPGGTAAIVIAPAARRGLQKAVKGTVLWQGDPAYEAARGAAVYRANKPKRFPAVIVLAESDKDVVAAVRFARDHGLKVGRRSGGHGWSSAHLRTGAMLIDLSRMQTVELDAKNRTLWTDPGVLGSRINAELKPHGLIIPTAHHPTVGIGGFAMCGGFGWNSRLWGNGAAHILAVDVVDAEGRLIRADETRNTDYLWAARGAGPGFFGVVTRMKLRANPMPPVMKVSAYGYTADVLEDLFTWARELVPKVPPYMELVIVSTAHDPKTGDRVPVRITVAALAITDTDQQADQALATASPATTCTPTRPLPNWCRSCAPCSPICPPRARMSSGSTGGRSNPSPTTWRFRCRARSFSAPIRSGTTRPRTRPWKCGRCSK